MNSNPIWTAETDKRAGNLAKLARLVSTNSPERKNLEHKLMLERDNLQHVFDLCRAVELTLDSPDQLGVALFLVVELKNIFRLKYSGWMKNRTQHIDYLMKEMKQKIFELYLRAKHKNLAKWIFDCIEVFIKHDYYPDCWPEFLNLVQIALQKGDHLSNIRIFKALQMLTKKYAIEERSDELYLEIIRVVEDIHDFILNAMKMYVDAIANESVDCLIAVKNLRILLTIFYDCIFQDIHEKIEDNILNWVSILKVILENQLQQKVLQMIGNSEKAIKNMFNLKGECVKVILLVNNKYKEDFDKHLSSFTEEIWKNCLSGNQKAGGKLMTYSIRYFKSFATNDKYQALFDTNMQNIVVKLILPNYALEQDDIDHFEAEPESFSQTLFKLYNCSVDPEKEATQQFLQSLGKFHVKSLFSVLQELYQSFMQTDIQKTGQEGLFQRITYLNILITAGTHKCNQFEGVRAIICPIEMITQAFENLLIPMMSLCCNNTDKMSIIQLFVLCQCLRFLNMFRYFLPIEKLLQALQLFIEKDLHVNTSVPGVLAYQKSLFVWANNILTMKQFQMIDNRNIDHTGMNFYQKHYLHPKNLEIKLDRKNFMIPKDQAIWGIVIKSIYSSFINENFKIDEEVLLLFKHCLKQLDTNIINFIDALLQVFEKIFSKIATNEILLNFGIINEVFESFGTLIALASKDSSTFEKFVPLTQQITNLFKKDVCELHSLIIQIFNQLINSYKINVAPDLPVQSQPFKTANVECTTLFKTHKLNFVITSCLNINNFRNEQMALSDVYLDLLVEAIKYCPSLIESEWNTISQILKYLIEQRMHLAVMTFLKDLIAIKVVNQHTTQFFIDYLLNMINRQNSASTAIEMQMFYKEVTLYLMLFIDINGVQNLFQVFSQMKAVPVIQTLFVKPEFKEFISKFSGTIERKYIMLMFTKFMFENSEVVINTISSDVYKGLLNSILENEYLRKFNYKALSMSRRINISYKKNLNKMTNNSFGSIFYFKSLEKPAKTHIKTFLANMNTVVADSGTLFLEKMKEMMNAKGIDPQQLIDTKYFKLFEN